MEVHFDMTACLDSFGDHAVYCKESWGFKYRHDMVMNVFCDICRRVGISARKEAPVNFLTDPSDGRSTLKNSQVPLWIGQAALKAVSCKVTKHEKLCIENQDVFIPFTFDTFGFLANEAVELVNRVQRVMNSNVMTPRSTKVNSLQSKLDQTAKISKSVFITNFSEECTSKDLWKECNDYGTVIDVFIPNKRSKSGKRFAFVRFIKVSNLDRLVENLNTIWMGRFHLSANRAWFDRPVVSPAPKQIPGIMSRPKYVQPNAIPKEKISSPPYLLKPSLVIDDSCLVSRDLDNSMMGEVRQVTSINNM
ncbi:RNA-directed DNA polymerase, eukaryota, nucleotide-binding alpha-beta plait domain protein [Tanacetum coccineum]